MIMTSLSPNTMTDEISNPFAWYSLFEDTKDPSIIPLRECKTEVVVLVILIYTYIEETCIGLCFLQTPLCRALTCNRQPGANRKSFVGKPVTGLRIVTKGKGKREV